MTIIFVSPVLYDTTLCPCSGGIVPLRQIICCHSAVRGKYTEMQKDVRGPQNKRNNNVHAGKEIRPAGEYPPWMKSIGSKESETWLSKGTTVPA